jgi:hypothetical protein
MPEMSGLLKSLDLQEELQGAFEITLDLEDGATRSQKLRLAENFVEIINSKRNIFRKSGVRLPEFFRS